MAILKLEVGKPIMMTIRDTDDVEGQFGPQKKFEAENGDCLFMSRDTANRQLERINGVMPGDMVRFEKVAKGSKTFINIDHVENAERAKQGNGSGPAPAGKAGASTSGGGVATPLPPQPPAPSPAKPSELYEKVTDYVLATIVPKMKAAGVPVTHEGTSAQIATLFIAANNGRH